MSRFSHVSPIFKSLHWLPVKQQIIFKTLLLIYNFLTTGKPKTLPHICLLYRSAVKTRCSNPEKMFLKVHFYSSTVHKSKVHFNKSFSYDAPNGMICHWKFKLLQHYHVSKCNLKPICFRSLFLLSFFLLPNTDDPLVTILLWFTTYDLCIMIWMVCLRICKFQRLSTWMPDA